MPDSIPVAERFDLDAGALSLDYVNTLDDRYDEQPAERIRDYDDLLAFAEAAGAVDADEAGQLAALALAQPGAAATLLAEALVLRETLFPIFAATAAGSAPDQADLDRLTPWVGRVCRHGWLRAEGDRVTWEWEAIDEDDPASLDRPLWPVVHDAVELLTHGDTSRLRECAAHDCGWLFLDTTRNRSRRWCSMQTCGNRAKVSHFRERQRG